MSFFVSDSLKGIITEKDLEADSPIKIVEEKEAIVIQFRSEENIDFDVELLEMNFCDVLDELRVATNTSSLENIFKCNNKKVNYTIFLNNCEAHQSKGTLILDKLEVNKEDNYVLCKIDIFKRGH